MDDGGGNAYTLCGKSGLERYRLTGDGRSIGGPLGWVGQHHLHI